MSIQTSASLAEAERTIKKLAEENTILRRELHETKTLYSQLIQESDHESFDERRVLLLKSQLIQMERQLLLMNESMSARATVQMEMENAMLDVADTCRNYVGIDNNSPDVSVPRCVLMRLVQTVESVRLKLSRTVENNCKEKLAKPLNMMNGFVKDDSTDGYTLFDICSGKTDHINLKQVSKLEAELCDLYQSLCLAENALGKLLIQKQNHDPRIHFSKAAVERQFIVTQTAVDKLRSCCGQLLDLSLLIPAAPIPAFRSKLKGLTSDKVLSSLPTTVRNKQDTKQVIDALMKSMNFTIHMKTLEINALKDELEFHQTVYEQQCQYVDDLFQAMKVGYGQFEKSAMEYLVAPLEEIFSTYETLKVDASEEALRDFLTSFKANADTLQSAVDKMKPDPVEERSEALSAFGEEFFADLLILQNECAQKRDEFLSELQIVKKQREENAELLQILLENNAGKKKENHAKLEYEKIMNMDDSQNDAEEDEKPRVRKVTKLSRKTSDSHIHPECDGCKNDDRDSEPSFAGAKPEIFTMARTPDRSTPPNRNGNAPSNGNATEDRKAPRNRSAPSNVNATPDRIAPLNHTTPPDRIAPAESRIPRTPISGSSFPRMTPSSSVSGRRSSSDRRSSANTAPTPSSTRSTSSNTSTSQTPVGVPVRALKLKK